MAANKTGRNDPCPCGSGKKYKKCCWASDEAARRQPTPIASASEGRATAALAPSAGSAVVDARPPSPARSPPSAPKLTPEQQWWEDFHERVETIEDVDELLTTTRRALAEAAAPEAEFLFEYVEPAFHALAGASRHAEVLVLIDEVGARYPEAYRESESQFALARFESALELPSLNLVEEARRMGPHVAREIELASQLPLRLAWDGSIAALRVLVEAAWPALQGRDDLFDWASDEWAAWGLGALLIERLEQAPGGGPDDQALRAGARLYEEGVGADRVDTFLRRWFAYFESPSALPVDVAILARLGAKDDDAAIEHATNLAAVAAARLRAQKGWSRGRAWLLLREMGGLLGACAEASSKKGVGLARGARVKVPLNSLLLPPPAIFLRKLSERNSDMFSSDPFTIAAVIFASPAWAKVVAERGGATEKEARDWLQQVTGEIRQNFAQNLAAARGDLAGQIRDFAEGEGRELLSGGPP
jgi:SEC-C motif